MVPDDYLGKVMEKYNSFQEMGFEDSVKKYQVDYILLDSLLDNFDEINEEIEGSVSFSRVYDYENIIIYKVD